MNTSQPAMQQASSPIVVCYSKLTGYYLPSSLLQILQIEVRVQIPINTVHEIESEAP